MWINALSIIDNAFIDYAFRIISIYNILILIVLI